MHFARRILGWLTLAYILSLAAGCSVSWGGPKVSETRTFTAPHSPGDGIRVETRNGSVRVEVDPTLDAAAVEAIVTCRGTTTVEARQRLAETAIDVLAGGGETVLRPVFPDKPRNGDGAKFLIRIPGASGAVIRSSNGGVNISGIAGGADVKTSNGGVELSGLDGAVLVRTSNGRITITDAAGSLDVHTSNGRIETKNVMGPVTAGTSNGSVEIRLHPEANGPVNISTSNGSVTLAVGHGFDGTVSMATSNGRVRLLDDGNRATGSSINKTRGTVTIGGGGLESRVTSSNGNIALVTTE